MKLGLKCKTYLGCFLLLISTLLLTYPVNASYTNNYTNVYDDADLLDNKEEKQLSERIKEYEDKYGATVIILTVNTVDREKPSLFAHNFADSIKLQEGIVFLVNMEVNNPSERSIQIQNYKSNDVEATKVFTNITSDRCTMIYDEIKSYFSSGDYYEGFKEGIERIDELASIPPSKDSDLPDYDNEYVPGSNYGEYESSMEDNILAQSWVQLLIALALGGAIVGGMAYTAGGRVTVNSSTYLNQSNSKVIGAYDHYIRTTVTRVKRETQDNNNHSSGGGGSSSHSSSSGSSHGGGGGF